MFNARLQWESYPYDFPPPFSTFYDNTFFMKFAQPIEVHFAGVLKYHLSDELSCDLRRSPGVSSETIFS